MIDEYNDNRTGWARFSDDYEMRYRLARSLDGRPIMLDEYGAITDAIVATFILLNPSIANAFIPDPTVTRCCNFARAWGCNVAQVANANALRSTDPRELYRRAAGFRGDDVTNNQEILLACRGALRVVAGWGVHGELGARGESLRRMLETAQIELHHLGLTKAGHPRHPLYLKATTEPVSFGILNATRP